MHWISALSTLVTLLFVAAVLQRYRRRGGAHLLWWGMGLAWYGLGTLAEVVLGLTFNAWVLKLWYLSGAMLTAAWLGQGTVFLLLRRGRWARGSAWVLLAVSLVAAALVFSAPILPAAADFQPALPVSSQYQDILGRSGLMLTLTILLNLYGTLTLVGGAIYSAYLFWRKQVLLERMVGNILIAAGALSPAMGGSLLRAGLADWLYVSELLGAVLMFLGFRLAVKSRPAEKAATSASS